ncbi:squalene/phytoene synthase family protein [Candidatus Magnetaquicoccus inordinatus]|uniref:squalene/phytoene synthase family protein n=1 Tax=Candidatus Magnetaquicoccus inordinatus TaxID=2496818 RepID=UPI00102B6EA2|nr:squalene/phytoene synthase family protein [Candidatus Magnetaquicoccus inordinatus]
MFSSNLIPAALEGDFRYCMEIVHNREENFPVASLLAPPRLRPFLYAIYAFARTADDFADLPGRDEETRMQLLDDWTRRLGQAEIGQPDHPIFRALAYVIRTTDLPTEPLHQLLIAFRMDVTNKRYDTLEELLEYCRYSANPVGRIVLHLAGELPYEAGEQELREERATGIPPRCRAAYADAICTALQLTNHLQDLGQDAWSGRPLYLPKEEIERFEVTEEMILKRRFSPAVGSLILHFTAQIRDMYLAGDPLWRQVPWPLNLELAMISECGLAVLNKIETAGGNTLRIRPRLSLWDRAVCFKNVLAQVIV